MRPAEFMLNPWVVASIVLLIVNDRVFKAAYGDAITGNLSDIGGVFLLTVLMVALIEAARFALRRRIWVSGRLLIVAAASITGVGFAAVKVVPVIGDAYEGCIELLTTMATASTGARITVYRDATDLLVLPVLLGSYAVVMKYRSDAARFITPPASMRGVHPVKSVYMVERPNQPRRPTN